MKIRNKCKIVPAWQDLLIKNVSELKKEFGDPVRVDKTAYGYDNYIYSQPGTSYMQVGVAKKYRANHLCARTRLKCHAIYNWDVH